jgi:hypothetical protein
MMDWPKAERKSVSFLRELDADNLHDQLDTIGAYLKELTNAFSKMAHRQWGRARDVEERMKDNLTASLILAVGLGMLVGLHEPAEKVA